MATPAPTDLPWDRPATNESAKAFAAFATYRDLGPDRSIRKAKEASGGSSASTRWWETWSSAHEWPARAAAYDAWLDAQLVARRRDEHLEMAERHATAARAAQGLVVRELQILDAREEARLAELRRRTAAAMPIDPELLKPTIPAPAIARLLKVGVEIERLSAGLATDIHQEIPVEEMTDEELARIFNGGE